jgi:hypothetical protein
MESLDQLYIQTERQIEESWPFHTVPLWTINLRFDFTISPCMYPGVRYCFANGYHFPTWSYHWKKLGCRILFHVICCPFMDGNVVPSAGDPSRKTALIGSPPVR